MLAPGEEGRSAGSQRRSIDRTGSSPGEWIIRMVSRRRWRVEWRRARQRAVGRLDGVDACSED